MFQFLTYLLHKQIIEMCHSQNLRRPLSVPCPTQWFLALGLKFAHVFIDSLLLTSVVSTLEKIKITLEEIFITVGLKNYLTIGLTK